MCLPSNRSQNTHTLLHTGKRDHAALATLISVTCCLCCRGSEVAEDRGIMCPSPPFPADQSALITVGLSLVIKLVNEQ